MPRVGDRHRSLGSNAVVAEVQFLKFEFGLMLFDDTRHSSRTPIADQIAVEDERGEGTLRLAAAGACCDHHCKASCQRRHSSISDTVVAKIEHLEACTHGLVFGCQRTANRCCPSIAKLVRSEHEHLQIVVRLERIRNYQSALMTDLVVLQVQFRDIMCSTDGSHQRGQSLGGDPVGSLRCKQKCKQ
jgi:hypothetical protein